MKKIKELIGQITRKGWIIITVLVLLIVVSVLLITFKDKNSKIWPLSLFKSTDQEEKVNIQDEDFFKKATDQIFTKENVLNGEYKNDIKNATLYVNSTEEVQVAVVKNENKNHNKPSDFNCGDVTFVTHRVVGPAVLTNSLKAMFEGKILTDFTPGNIIPSYHPNLTLEKVMIENGVAQIYLNGNFGGEHNGWCDADLALAQIGETAKKFSSVKEVKIYQDNNQIYPSK